MLKRTFETLVKKDRKIKKRRSNLLVLALKGKSEVLDLIGQGKKALKEINTAIAVTKKLNDKKLIADCILQISNIYSSLSRYDDMLNSGKEALLLYEEIKERKGAAESLNNIGYVQTSLGNYKEALKYHKRSLQINVEIGDRDAEAYSYSNFGSVHGSLGNYKEALQYYNRALKIQEEIGNKKGVAYSLNKNGILHIEMEEFKTASKYLNRALKMAVELGEKEVLRRVHISLAELCLQTKEYDEVKHHLKSAFTLADELGFKQGKGEALLISARLRSLKGKIDKDVFDECISIFKQLNNPFALAKVYYYYAEALSACSSKPAADSKGKKEKCKAKSYLKEAEKIFKKKDAQLWLYKVEKLWQRIRGHRSVQHRS